MFLFSQRRRSPLSVRTNRAQLALERLETRECLSAPELTLSLTPLSGNSVLLSGNVVDEYPDQVTITFSGAASGTVQPNSSGNFSYTAETSGSGTITGTALDLEDLTDTASVEIPTNQAPVIQVFEIETVPSSKVVQIRGAVIDENRVGLTVTFTGKVTGQATTDADGKFTLSATATAQGLVTASVTDAGGLTGTKNEYVLSFAPQLLEIHSASNSPDIWTVWGKTDARFAGMEVEFGDEIPEFAGQKATVQSDGSFELTRVVNSNAHAWLSVTLTDAWGQTSNVLYAEVG